MKRDSSSLLCVGLPSQVCHGAVLVDGENVGLIGGVDCVGVVGGDVQPAVVGQEPDEDFLASACARSVVQFDFGRHMAERVV